MVEVVISILVLASVVVIFPNMVAGFKFPVWISRLGAGYLHKRGSDQSREVSARPDTRVLNCRVRPTRQKKDSCSFDAFSVEICGFIHAPCDGHRAAVSVSITDITDGVGKAQPVHSRLKQWQKQDSPVFAYNADLGKFPNADNTLSDWMSVAQIGLDWLAFPVEGKRELQFKVSIVSGESSDELACAECTFSYENAAFGYMDLGENIQRAKTLAVALAFAVSAADKKLYDCEVALIKEWARTHIGISQASNSAKRKLEKALNETVRFFRDGNQLDSHDICKEIAEIASVAERYDILELCLRVAQANGTAAAEELALLKRLASWLEVDMNRFRTMMEKILPVSMHEVEDAEVILGVSSDMSEEKTREHLNREYRKWNARVTSSDPEIQSQADYMLKFIAQARSEYIAQDI